MPDEEASLLSLMEGCGKRGMWLEDNTLNRTIKTVSVFCRMDIARFGKIVYNKADAMCRRSGYPVSGMRGPG